LPTVGLGCERKSNPRTPAITEDKIALRELLEKGSDASFLREMIGFAAERLMVGWVFLWAAIYHFGDDSYVAGFLSRTKTFHPIYGPIAQSPVLPLIFFWWNMGIC
jgi:hypothetical protein